MNNKNRIAIVGISGSGKSTLANKIGIKLGRPVIHLDKHYWDVGWKERYSTKEEFREVVKKMAEADTWIIDGNYRSSIDIRLARADTIIFLDFPKWKCLWRAFKRVLNRKQPFDKVEGVKAKIDWPLVKFILTYPQYEMRAKIESYKEGREVLVAKNDRETEKILQNITTLV